MQSLALLAQIGFANALGTALLGANQRQYDNGSKIGNHLEELIRNTEAADLQTNLECITEAEEQTCQQDAACAPTTKDDCCQRNKAATCHIAVCISRRIASGQIGTADACQCTTNDTCDILQDLLR